MLYYVCNFDRKYLLCVFGISQRPHTLLKLNKSFIECMYLLNTGLVPAICTQ